MSKGNETDDLGSDYWAGILPEQIELADMESLVSTIAGELAANPAILDALNTCNLQPTSRAGWLAAGAAVHVLLANEIGQEVADDEVERCVSERLEAIKKGKGQ